MKRSGPPKRTKSDYQLEYEKMIPLIHVRSGGRCEILAAHDCDGIATDSPHHRKLRSQRGTNTMTNLIDTCFSGHQWIHTQLSRDKAEELGLIIPSHVDEYPYEMRDQ